MREGINDIRIDGIFVILFVFGFEYDFSFSILNRAIVFGWTREQCLGTFIYHKVVTLKKSKYKKLCVFDLIRLDLEF